MKRDWKGVRVLIPYSGSLPYPELLSSLSYYRFSPSTASRAKILANPLSRVTVKSVSRQDMLRFPKFHFFRIWPGLLEAWLVLTSVKYHGNLYILIPLNQRLALTRLRATGPWLVKFRMPKTSFKILNEFKNLAEWFVKTLFLTWEMKKKTVRVLRVRIMTKTKRIGWLSIYRCNNNVNLARRTKPSEFQVWKFIFM